MKKFIGAIVLALSMSLGALAQSVPQESIFPGLTGNELLESLAAEYGPDTILNYDNARDEMFTFVDNNSGMVVCVYTGVEIPINPASSSPRADALSFNFNTEHIWPQSKGAQFSPQVSDLHHLRPARANVNTSRGNKPFGIIDPAQVNTWWKGTVSQSNTPGGNLGEWSRTATAAFQVRDAEMGNVARSMFYFFLLYSQDALTADPDFFANQIQVLRTYHNQDLVDLAETTRNGRVETIQGNVNPFIADTTLVRRAFFEDFDPDDDIGNEGYLVDFENGSKNTSGYQIGTASLSGIQWTFSEALFGSDAGDVKIGARSARLRNSSNPENVFLRMDENKENGLGEVTFMYSRSDFSGDRTGNAPVFVLEFSIDNGANWTAVGTPFDLSGINEFQEGSRIINVSDPGRVRFRAISGDSGKRFNIDNIRITDFSDITLPLVSNVSISEISTTSADAESSVESDGGGTITARGFVYSALLENDEPLIGGDFVTNSSSGTGSGAFSETIHGLQQDTDYVIKSYATNELGTIYSEALIFSTPAEAEPDASIFADVFDLSQGGAFTTSGTIGTSDWQVARAGSDWGARIHEGILELTNTASGAANASGWVFAHTSVDDFGSGFRSVPDQNFGIISWSFNLRQIRSNPAGFNSGSYGAAFVLGATSENVANEGSGYAVVLGNTLSPDPIRLVSFNNGLQSLGSATGGLIEASGGSPLEDPGNQYMSLKVTFNTVTGEWQLFGRVDGGTFENPEEGELTFIGSVVNTDYADVALPFMGAYWQGSTAGNQTAFIDNARVKVDYQTEETSTVVTGNQGWRLLSAPVSDITFGTLFQPFWTQGIPGADFPNGDPNIWTFDVTALGGADFTVPESMSETVKPGEGYLFYMYENDDNETGSFPKNWSVSGMPLTDDVTIPLNAQVDGFTLVGNPYPVALNWDVVLDENPDLKATIYLYDNAFNPTEASEDILLASGGYRTWNGTGGSLGNYLIAPFQGFWIQSDVPNATLTIPSEARAFNEDPVFYDEPELANSIHFLSQSDTGIESEIWLTFNESGSVESNRYDALALQTLDYASHLSMFISQDEHALSIKHLPLDIDEAIRFPLHITPFEPGNNDGFQEFGTDMSLMWTIPVEMSATWKIYLEDSLTNDRIQLTNDGHYDWEHEISKNEPKVKTYRFGAFTENPDEHESRFYIVLEPQTTHVDVADTPQAVSLAQNYPNPFNPATSIQYTIPEEVRVQLDVYNAMGQRVATLWNGTQSKGTHTVQFDAGSLASGLYIYRLRAGNTVLTNKMMLVK